MPKLPPSLSEPAQSQTSFAIVSEKSFISSRCSQSNRVSSALRLLHHFDGQDLDGFSQGIPADCDDDDSEMENFFTTESLMCSEDYENADCVHNDYEEGQGQQSTAAAKLQIKLNHLINSHKAPIKLYDDIIHLFNDYICSPNFDKFA